MFKRLSYEEWQALVPIIAFSITFLGFLVFAIRAAFMRRDDVSRMASLPIEGSSGLQRKENYDVR